jgi:cytochrome b6-f complex iron-sulfur subunit
VSSLCTHQQVLIDFQASNNRFYCSGHGSVFSTTGAVLNGPAAAPLKQYKTARTGNSIRIFE